MEKVSQTIGQDDRADQTLSASSGRDDARGRRKERTRFRLQDLRWALGLAQSEEINGECKQTAEPHRSSTCRTDVRTEAANRQRLPEAATGWQDDEAGDRESWK